MTPEALRILADEMDTKEGASAPSETVSHVREVAVDGIKLEVDMRRFSDVRTMRAMSKVYKEGSSMSPESAFAAFDLIEWLFGEQSSVVEDHLRDADGYVSADAYTDFLMRAFYAVGAEAKN